MRIAVIGAQSTGKSTFIDDFIKQWPMYKKGEKGRYSNDIKKEKLNINEEGTKESQKYILNSLIDQIMEADEGDNVIFDRSVLDNLVYTMWLFAKGKIKEKFVEETISIVKETLPFYDILFFTPISKVSPVPFEPSEHTSTDKRFREEIDNIFKSLMSRYVESDRTYFPLDHELGCPALIEIFGNREERIELAKFYVNENGGMFDEEDSLMTLSEDEQKIKDEFEGAMNIHTPNKNIIIPS